MKKTALGVLALAGTLFVQLAVAGPSTAAERVTTKTEMRGEGVTAEFVRTDGCIQTYVTRVRQRLHGPRIGCARESGLCVCHAG
jgi:hypothetical protein